eukprot:Polyplicarium_translucidae@DN3329_c1_g2_i9.p1
MLSRCSIRRLIGWRRASGWRPGAARYRDRSDTCCMGSGATRKRSSSRPVEIGGWLARLQSQMNEAAKLLKAEGDRFEKHRLRDRRDGEAYAAQKEGHGITSIPSLVGSRYHTVNLPLVGSRYHTVRLPLPAASSPHVLCVD